MIVANPYRIRWARLAFETAQSRFEQARKTNERGGNFSETLEVVRSYELLSSALYRIRGVLPDSDPYRVRAEDLVASLAQDVLNRQPASRGKGTYAQWLREYRRIWRENLALFGFTVLLFLGGTLAGWKLSLHSPAFVGAMFSQPMLEKVLDHQPWFESLQKDALMGGLGIAFNNIKVSINIFLGGALLGLGGFWLLIYNGLMLGGLLGFCSNNQFDEPLRNFVIGHGPLELTIVMAAAFASFILGRAFYRRPVRELPQRLARAGREAAFLLAGALPWLLLAAFIEAFVSPRRDVGPETKLGVGLVAAVLFWVWTFWPADGLRSGRNPSGGNKA